MPLTVLEPNCALIVIDLQRNIVDAPAIQSAARAVVELSAAMAAAFRSHDLPVVLVNVTGAAPGRTERRRPQPTERSARGADLADELDVQPGDHLITKRRRSAFHDTGLDTLLRDLGVTQVVLAGISTTSGVEGTARAAYDHGYHVVLAVDAMLDADAQAHANSVQRIFPKLGETAASAEILDMLAARR